MKRDCRHIHDKVFDAACEILNVDSRDPVIALANNRERGKIGVQTEPCAPKELVEYILSVTVGESRAHYVDFEETRGTLG